MGASNLWILFIQEMAMLRFHQSQQGKADADGSSADSRMDNKTRGDGDGANRGMFLDNYGEHEFVLFPQITRSH